MGRVRVFAAPFVVTVALGGCKQADDDAASKPPPRAKPDAAMSRNPPMPTPDAQVAVVVPPDAAAKVVVELPDAKPGAIVYGQDGACFTGFRVPVKCPADGAPILLTKLVLDDPIPWIYLQEGQLACFREQPYDCPVQPPGVAVSCNPPAPLPVECPDELMPRLRADLEPDRKDGKCTYQGVQVRCP